MKSTINDIEIPATANYVHQGEGTPVVLVHGLAASLHDWDELIPVLTENGYASYALDLLGHGDSPKPGSRAYHVDWVFEHFLNWITSLRLTEPAIIIGHSLGGYIALEYAHRFSAWTRGLILIDPFYSLSQLPILLRRTYRHPILSGMIAQRLPEWMFRVVVDITSVSLGHGNGAIHSLPQHVRAQTALDYTRTAAGVYNVPNTINDLTDALPSISLPTLVVWGSRDQTLAPASFQTMVNKMPRAERKTFDASHVPHQSNAEEFNELVIRFLHGIV
jgi:pimeloyl-ACP methyl ester carboxylesterase